jgi:RNA polymerase sigma-70 factor (ECF subfamily)
MLRHDASGLSDGQLLDLYAEGQDQAAFEAIVRRHGPMVMGVCRRVLADHHDAEDAFQATFLVLFRKARAIAARELLANWLYGVAYNMARKARAAAAKRRLREKQITETLEREVPQREEIRRDLLLLFDRELSRLPDRYRLPIILCALDGKAQKDAAKQLGWPIGTVSGRLARGKMILAKLLARHGLSLSTVSMVTLLSQDLASAAVPVSVVSATLKAAARIARGHALSAVVSSKVAILTEGALRSMLLTRLKIVTPVLVTLSLLGVGVAESAYRTAPPTLAPAPQPQDQGIGQDPKTDKEPFPGAGRNLLQNAGIEEGDKSPAHWSQGAEVNGVEYIWDKQVGYKSKSSLCLHKTAKRYFPIAEWYQVVARRGDRPEIRVSAQVKAEKVTKAILDVLFLDADDGWISHQWAAYIGDKEPDKPATSHDWKEYSGNVKIPQNTKKIRVGLQIYGPGKLWFDDVRAEYTD